MVRIIFESHATSKDNEAGLSSGNFDVELSDLGKQQAKELGERHRYENLSAIFCSDLKRSYNTAEIAFEGRDIPIIKDKRLRECDYGDLTKHPSSEVEAARIKYISKPFPNGESYKQTALRMKSFLEFLLKNYQSKKIMIIGHRATQYGLENWIKGISIQKAVTAPWQWQPGWEYKLEKIVLPEDWIDYPSLPRPEIINCVVQFEDKILIVKRSSEMRIYPDFWSGVSGFLEDATIEEKVREELKEEVAITEKDIISIKEGKVFEIQDSKYDKTWVVHPIIVKVKTDKINLDWESQEFKWIERNQIKEFKIVPNYIEVLKVFIDLNKLGT